MGEALRNAGLLLRAEIRCNNGCGCEELDFCAEEEWDKALQLEWMDEMERIEQEVFPDARPRSEVVVDLGASDEGKPDG